MKSPRAVAVRLLLLTVALLAVPPAAAEGEKDLRLVGHWTFTDDGDEVTLDAKEDGTFVLAYPLATVRGTWRLLPGVLVVKPDGDEEVRYASRFESDDVIVISHAKEGTYRLKRVKTAPPPKVTSGPALPLPASKTGHIVYTRWGKHGEIPLPQLWVMNGDGSGRRPFFAPKDELAISKQARWSPDYDRLAFVSTWGSARSACMEDIFVAHSDGSRFDRVTGNEVPAGPHAYGSVTGLILDNVQTLDELSKARLQINITAQGGDGKIHHPGPPRELDIVNRDTGERMTKVRAWRFTIPKVLAASKVWIKVWADKYMGNLVFADVEPGKTTDVGHFDLNHGLYYASTPSLSRDPKFVVGTGSIASWTMGENPVVKGQKTPMTGGADNVCVYDAKTGAVLGMFEPTRAAGENAQWPAVSADGKTIAVCWGKWGAENLALLSTESLLANRATPRVLVPGRQRLFEAALDGASSPSWSPDGRSIVFARSSSGTTWVTAQICVANVDGSGVRALTRVGPNQVCTHPTWSPDGSRIAFTVLTSKAGALTPEALITFQFTADIYSIKADGTDLRRLTDDGISVEPAWGR